MMTIPLMSDRAIRESNDENGDFVGVGVGMVVGILVVT